MPRRSVFFKLLLVFALAGTANLVLLRLFYRNVIWDDIRRLHRRQNMIEYAHLLAGTLPDSPSADQVAEMASRLHMQIRIEGAGYTRVSSPTVPTFPTVDNHFKLSYETPDAKIGHFGDFLAIEILKPTVRYLFMLESEDALEGHSQLMAALAAVLILILLAIYLCIRRILAPLRSLQKGVQEVSAGNLGFVIPRESRDELGQLVESFNGMTEQVRTMIRSREQLLLDVSHEFRSPLTRMKVALELPGEDARHSVKRAIRELETMISELLESARLDTVQGKLKLERVDLANLIQDLVTRYEKEGAGVRLLSSGPPWPFFAAVDPSRISTALQNLLENAIKYSTHQSRPVEVSLSRPSPDRIGITFRDFGIGIPREDLALVFEPFYRVDRSRVRATGGYGLGLSLCKKIIEAHRGSIHVQSTLARETVFQIELPV